MGCLFFMARIVPNFNIDKTLRADTTSVQVGKIELI